MKDLIQSAVEVYNKEGFEKTCKKSYDFVRSTIKDRIFELGVILLAPSVDILDKIQNNDPKLVLFSTAPGRFYKGNPRYVFEYILENRKEITPVWMAHSKKVYNELDEVGLPVVYVYSLEGITILSKAPVYVAIHHRGLSIDPRIVPDTVTFINTNHGDGVMGEFHLSEDEIRDLRRPFEKYHDYWLTTSEFIRDARMKNFTKNRGDIEKFVNNTSITFEITGYPRNDILLDTTNDIRLEWEQFTQDIDVSSVILYAPSKHYGIDVSSTDPAVKFFPFSNFDHEQLFDFLEEHQTLLLIRPHPGCVEKMMERSSGPYDIMQTNIEKLCSGSQYVKKATQYQYEDVNRLLPFVDSLITDYSSIYHDFLLLDRPILFIPYDFEAYQNERGFVYDYYQYLPGPKVDSFEQFKELIKSINDGNDTHVDRRHNLRNLIHEHQDSQSRERVTELIIDKLEY